MDEYDRHIEELTNAGRDEPGDQEWLQERRIMQDWAQGRGLFKFLSPSGGSDPLPPERNAVCGCLTTVKGGGGDVQAWTPEMTDRIRADDRVPAFSAYIRIEHLPVFAEYQREADRTFRVKREEVASG